MNDNESTTNHAETARANSTGAETSNQTASCGLPLIETEERLFPCKSDDEVRLALEKLVRQVRIEVAGGIVRHHTW